MIDNLHFISNYAIYTRLKSKALVQISGTIIACQSQLSEVKSQLSKTKQKLKSANESLMTAKQTLAKQEELLNQLDEEIQSLMHKNSVLKRQRMLWQGIAAVSIGALIHK